MKRNLVFVAVIVALTSIILTFLTVNALDGFASCAEKTDLCANKLCPRPESNPVATVIERIPQCNSTDGVCHCYVEQAPNSASRARPPTSRESDCSKACPLPTEYAVVMKLPATSNKLRSISSESDFIEQNDDNEYYNEWDMSDTNNNDANDDDSEEIQRKTQMKKYCVCFSTLKN